MFFSQKKIKKKPPKPGYSLISKFWKKKKGKKGPEPAVIRKIR
jgi:hypothetical protein